MADPPTASPSIQQSSAPVVILSTTPPNDPPPPYPARERRRTVRSGRRRRTITTPAIGGVTDPDAPEHPQIPSGSTDVYSDYDPGSPFPSGDGHEYDATEHTPLLANASPRLPAGGISRRQRTLSVSSTVHSVTSFAPSLAHTVISAFHPDRDCDLDPEEATPIDTDSDEVLDSPTPRPLSDEQQRMFASELGGSPRLGGGTMRRRGRWSRYFRPMVKGPYYAALFHLLFLNFTYALAAWVYLFVFTLVRRPNTSQSTLILTLCCPSPYLPPVLRLVRLR